MSGGGGGGTSGGRLREIVAFNAWRVPVASLSSVWCAAQTESGPPRLSFCSRAWVKSGRGVLRCGGVHGGCRVHGWRVHGLRSGRRRAFLGYRKRGGLGGGWEGGETAGGARICARIWR